MRHLDYVNNNGCHRGGEGIILPKTTNYMEDRPTKIYTSPETILFLEKRALNHNHAHMQVVTRVLFKPDIYTSYVERL